jgi:hypothetical protein
VLTLKTVCEVQSRNPTDPAIVDEIILDRKAKQEFLARDAWILFQKLATDELQRSNVSASASQKQFKKVAELMLNGPTEIDNVGKILRENSTALISSRDIGAWNAEAGICHPFDPFEVDPFNGTMSASGSAVTAVFRDLVAPST